MSLEFSLHCIKSTKPRNLRYVHKNCSELILHLTFKGCLGTGITVLGMENLTGIFLIFIIGICLAVIIELFGNILNRKK